MIQELIILAVTLHFVSVNSQICGSTSPVLATSTKPGLRYFVDVLPKLRVIQPSDTSNGVNRYEIPITEFKQQLHADLPFTTLRGYDSSFPGPTIEALSGRPVQVKWINKLPETSTLLANTATFPSGLPHNKIITHLHGANTSAESDGHPSSAVGPSQTFTANYTNNQPPATLWYHDHAMGISRTNVYLGLSGLYIIRASVNESIEMNVPANDFEIPLIIQDRSFMADGQLTYPDKWVMEFLGDVMLANGKVWPYLEVQPTKYRLRLLNGCNSRVLNLRFSNASLGFTVIGNDNGYLNAVTSVSSIRLSPSERVDVIVDFCGHVNEDIIITNDAINPMTGPSSVNPCTTGRILQFRVRDSNTSTLTCTGVSVKLSTEARSVLIVSPENAVMTRDIVIMTDMGNMPHQGGGGMPGMHRKSRAAMQETDMMGVPKLGIRDRNGKPKLFGFSNAATEFISPGTIEVWRLINLSDDIHPIH